MFTNLFKERDQSGKNRKRAITVFIFHEKDNKSVSSSTRDDRLNKRHDLVSMNEHARACTLLIFLPAAS